MSEDFYGSGQMALPASGDQSRYSPAGGEATSVDLYGSGQMRDPPPPPPPTTFLNRAWTSLANIPGEILHPTPATASGPPGIGKKLGEGFVRGVHDVADTPSVWLARQLGFGDTATQRTADERQKFEQNYGDSTVASIGRVGGQTVATLPVLSGAGALATRSASLIPGAIGRGAQFVAGSAPAETVIGRGTQLALQGAGTGATQAALTSSASDQPLVDQMTTGALTGAVAGPAIGGLTKAVDVLRGYAGGVRPEIAALADRARQLGVNVPVSSMSTNPFMRIVADAGKTLPASGADAAALNSQRQLQGVIAREMGSTANTFGPAEMRATADRLSQAYQTTLAKVPSVSGGVPLANDLATIGGEASRAIADKDALASVGRAIRETGDAFRGGPISAKAYDSLMKTDGPLDRLAKAAPSSALPYIQRVKDALKARLQASAPTADIAQEIKDIDRQWRAMKTVQPLSAVSTTGDISPGGLMQRMAAQSSKFDSSTGGLAYTGGGTLGDAARIGKQFFGHIPESGTAPRMQAYEFARHPIATTLAALPSVLGNRYLQQWLRSPAVSGRVIDTSLGAATPNIGRAIPYGLLGPIDAQR